MAKKDTGKVNIHGREYQVVAARVQQFREEHALFGLLSEVVIREGDVIVVKAWVEDESGRVVATGHAEEDRTKSQINRTSALENCETSAIGRALASFGYGGTEFASANEIQNSNKQHSDPVLDDDQLANIEALITETGADPNKFCTFMKVNDIPSIKQKDYDAAVKALEAKRGR